MADIRNIRRNGDNTPSRICRCIGGNLHEIKRIYKGMNGQAVIVWDIGEEEQEKTFITTWKINAVTFTFPALEYLSRNGTIDWGDNSEIEEYSSSADCTHTYAAAGQYTIKIDCPVELIKAQAFLNRTELIEITCTTAKVFEQQCFRGCTNLATAAFSQETKEIPNLMFHNCKKLASFRLDGLERIGYSSFLSSGLSGILEIPTSVVFVGVGAFRECTGITKVISKSSSIVFDNDTVNMNYSRQFYDDYEVSQYELSAETIPEGFASVATTTALKTHTVVFAEGVKTIGKAKGQPCFTLGAAGVEDCHVYIPSTTEAIGTLCKIVTGQTGHSHVLYVHYAGTAEEWQKIKINAVKGFWTDGTPYVQGYLCTSDGNKYAFKTHGTGIAL